MAGHRARPATGAALVAAAAALAAAALTGCSGDDGPSGAASKAASAARSVGGEATAAASSFASRAAEGLASATAEAGRRFDEIKGGADAKDDVRLGAPKTDGGGRTTVPVTVRNTADSAKSFTVQVEFTDPGGALRDTVVVTVGDVPGGGSGKATARSNRELSGEVRARVARAVRY